MDYIKYEEEKLNQFVDELEKKLKEVEESNKSAWETYGSELSTGEMIENERKIEREIGKLKNKLEPNETYKRLVEKSKEHKHELVFNCGPTLSLLLPGIEDDGEDYYWRLFDLNDGYCLSSCVGRIDFIKGKIDDDAYEFLFNIFRMNYKRALNSNDKLSSKIREEIEQILK